MPKRKTRAVTEKGSPASESRNGQQAPTYREVFARTGETPAGNIEWLLSFVGLPLEGFDVHRRAALIEEVFAVCTLAGSAKPAVWKKAQLPGFRDYPGYPEFAHPFFGRRWLEVVSLHTIAREAVTRCADRLPLRLPKIKMEMDLNFDQWGTKDPRPTGAPFWVFPPTCADEEMEGAFIYRLACVLAIEGDRIGRCQSHTCRRPLRLICRLHWQWHVRWPFMVRSRTCR